jgi:hypothetical protein
MKFRCHSHVNFEESINAVDMVLVEVCLAEWAYLEHLGQSQKIVDLVKEL